MQITETLLSEPGDIRRFIHKAGHFQDFEFIQFFPFSKISPKRFPKTRPRILQHFFPEMVTDIPYGVCQITNLTHS
ncbi:hypothetical protein QL807_005003 [Escherichia coli]|nr:hypothetical protein [Escherichia coli]